MQTTAETLRAYRGPVIFSFGFRSFFLGGAIWAFLAMGIFAGSMWGGAALPITMGLIDWHVHELLYGFLPAIAAGFLLTAIPNWTGRLPVAGLPLAAIFVIWAAGRAAIAFSALIGAYAAAAVDLLFLVGLAALIGREIIAGKNLRNLKILVLIGLLALGNAIFHMEVIAQGFSDYGIRVGVGIAILLIMIIGGRIIPSFTRNWLARRQEANLPAPFNRFDVAAIAIGGAAIAIWIVLPDNSATAIIAAVAGAAHLIRLARWRGEMTLAEPLVAVLHAGYAFVPLGFLLLALSIAAPDILLPSAAVHGWTAGAVGLMTLAVMTRASLGHTGRDLTATPGIVGIYLAAALGALARIAAGFGWQPDLMLKIGAIGWILAFGGFCVAFGVLLMTARR